MSTATVKGMSQISAGFHMSLDGYIARPGGELDWMEIGPDMADYATETMRTIDTMLMGQVNFREQAASWPDRRGDLADAVNAHDKLVISSRPDEIDLTVWEGSRAVTDPAAEIALLRQRPDKRVGIAGGATLLRSLFRQELIDEIRVITHPVTLGAGLTPWPAGMRLQLTAIREFDSGAVLHTYRPLRHAVNELRR